MKCDSHSDFLETSANLQVFVKKVPAKFQTSDSSSVAYGLKNVYKTSEFFAEHPNKARVHCLGISSRSRVFYREIFSRSPVQSPVRCDYTNKKKSQNIIVKNSNYLIRKIWHLQTLYLYDRQKIHRYFIKNGEYVI